jgi:hypothetical protein
MERDLKKQLETKKEELTQMTALINQKEESGNEI